MTAAALAQPPARRSDRPRPQRPYVGIRPIERAERQLVHGRDQDVGFLCDKLFSAPITVLYGRSGLGKTTLLRALLAPRVEHSECVSIYFDAWCGPDPASALRNTVATRAEALGIADPLAGAPSLRELVRLLATLSHKTVILVLDQFEDLLVSNAENSGEVRRSLAELARASELDVHVLLSVREEFLAELEPLRVDVLHLFRSTYRLEPLDDEALRRAIEEPAKLFDVSYEQGLIPALLTDLRRAHRDVGSAARDPHDRSVPLPFLQLVCDDLWTAKGGRAQITRSLYREQGGVRGMLERYVRSSMPRSWRQRVRTASMLEYLAPATGLKSACAARDLARYTNYRVSDVQAELRRLGALHILQRRTVSGQELFELQHDVLIGILAPWRDDVIARARRLRWLTIGLVALFPVLAPWAFFAARDAERHRWQHAEQLADLERLSEGERRDAAPARFDSLVVDHLGHHLAEDTKAPFAELRAILERYGELVPDGWGITRSGIELVSDDDQGEAMVFRYSPDRALDANDFKRQWMLIAKAAVERRGIPVPARIRLLPDSTYPSDWVTCESDGRKIAFGAPQQRDSQFMLDADHLNVQARAFFDAFVKDWTPLQLEHGPAYLVPRWSLPLWKVTGSPIASGSAALAELTFAHLLSEPDTLLSRSAVALVLDRLAQLAPVTVAEARAARGERLRQDLAELTAQEGSLFDAAAFLDMVAAYPDEPSKQVVARFRAADADTRVAPREMVAGPHKAADNTSEPEIESAYRAVEGWMQPPQGLVRVALATNLVDRWTTQESALTPGLQGAMADLRDRFRTRFGLTLPGVRFAAEQLESSTIVISLAGQPQPGASLQLPDDDPEAALGAALEARVSSSRVVLANSDQIAAILPAPSSPLRRWVDARYSLTDLKQVARAVLGAGDSGADEPPADATLRDFPGLIESLVFLMEASGTQSISEHAAWLRRMQAARSESMVTDDDDPLGLILRAGIEHVGSGRITQGVSSFRSALRLDAERARASYPLLWAAHVEAQTERALETACASDDATLRASGIQAWQTERAGGRGASPDARSFCRYRAYSNEQSRSRQALARTLLAAGPSLSWHDAAHFANSVLAEMDPMVDWPALGRPASELLLKVLEKAPPKVGDGAWEVLLGTCRGATKKKWCTELLSAGARHGASVHRLTSYAEFLIGGYPSELEATRRVLAEAETHLRKLPARERSIYRDLIALLFARADVQAWLHGSPKPFDADRTARELESLDNSRFANGARASLADLRVAAGSKEVATAAVSRAMRAGAYDSVVAFATTVLLNLQFEDPNALVQTASARPTGCDDEPDCLFVATIAEAMTKTSTWEHTARRFLQTSHTNVPYVALIVASRIAPKKREQARGIVAQRWKSIDRDSWPARLREGDENVWREQLIGYFAGEVTRAELFDPISSEEAFARSELRHQPLPRLGMLCEALFYDALGALGDGNNTTARQLLTQVLATDVRAYYEYGMARFLLAELDDGSTRAPSSSAHMRSSPAVDPQHQR